MPHYAVTSSLGVHGGSSRDGSEKSLGPQAALALTLLQDKMAKRRQLEQKVTTPPVRDPIRPSPQITEKSS
jgi:hypothetical protein